MFIPHGASAIVLRWAFSCYNAFIVSFDIVIPPDFLVKSCTRSKGSFNRLRQLRIAILINAAYVYPEVA